MNLTCFHQLADIPAVEIAPGFYSRMIHTPYQSLNFITVSAGNAVPLHRHIHTQQSIVLEGQFEMTVNGVTQILEPGSVCMIPSMADHGGKAITDCRILDLFQPMREEYAKLGGVIIDD